MFMTIQLNVKDKILATPSKTSKTDKLAQFLAIQKISSCKVGKRFILMRIIARNGTSEIGESSLTGPELVLDPTDKVVLIKQNLKAARDHQKSYADNRRKPLEFEVGDRVLLKVSPWKGVIMDHEIRNLKRSKIQLVKVHWKSKRGPEFTWEREDHMKSKYP
ncbi:hypothetical protein Tco_1244562 [Tanacetum coccineum]